RAVGRAGLQDLPGVDDQARVAPARRLRHPQHQLILIAVFDTVDEQTEHRTAARRSLRGVGLHALAHFHLPGFAPLTRRRHPMLTEKAPRAYALEHRPVLPARRSR